MNVAVTGATGFVGRHIVRSLLARGHTVRLLTRHPVAPSPESDPAVTTIAGDLADSAALRALVTNVGAVVHLVGIIAERGRATFEAVHVEGTRMVVAAAAAAGCRRIVHMSAAGARDAPGAGATPYQRTKARAETIVLASDIAATVFRPSLIVGPGNVPVRLLARLHRFLPVVPMFGSGAFPMQPVWVEDVARAFALAVERPGLTGIFELGGPDLVTYAEFVRAIGVACRHPRPLVPVPLAWVRAAARTVGWLPAALITSDQLQMLIEGSATPANAIDRVFGIAPLPLREALRRCLG